MNSKRTVSVKKTHGLDEGLNCIGETVSVHVEMSLNDLDTMSRQYDFPLDGTRPEKYRATVYDCNDEIPLSFTFVHIWEA